MFNTADNFLIIHFPRNVMLFTENKNVSCVQLIEITHLHV